MITKKRLRWWLCCLSWAIAGGTGTAASAADDEVVYQKKTVYNFEDDTITGDLTRPDQELVSGRKKSSIQSLIKIREDFKEKVFQSVGDL